MCFRKEKELKNGETALRSLLAQNAAALPKRSTTAQANVKMLTSCPNCPSCLQGLKHFEVDINSGLLEADYIVVEMARRMLGENWLPYYLVKANNGASSGCWCSSDVTENVTLQA